MSTDELFGGEPVITFHKETDRRAFLRWTGLVGVGAALVSTGALTGMATASADAPAPSTNGDAGILNYALTLEYLEYNFYAMGLSKGLLSGRDLELVTPIRSHEQAHVKAVMAAVTQLKGTPVSQPKLKFPAKTFSSADNFLATAVMFEELGVTAYQGQVPLIQSVAVLQSAATIAGVESRHAAILEQLTNGNPFPSPVEKSASMSSVLANAKPYLA
ncbi:MAG: ferritin-like domain-containing protein [Actinomycetota bacterium]|nr:ferritin-like domain-containing protein [Actinomycetota bacterium]